MVSTLQVLSVEPAAVQRHAAVRARVAQSERLAETVAADDQGNFQQRGFVQLVAVNAIGGQGAIPEAGEHQCVGGLALREFEIGHGKI